MGCVDDDRGRPLVHSCLHHISHGNGCLRDIVTACEALRDAVGADESSHLQQIGEELGLCVFGELSSTVHVPQR